MSGFKSAKAVLERNFLFKGLPEASLECIASLAIRREYDKGTIVFSQGDDGDGLYGVISGRVRISATGANGQEVFLNIMDPGDTFGEIAVMDSEPRTAGAMAVEETTLIFIKRTDFLDLLEREPRLAIHLLKLMCGRLRWTSEMVEESAFLNGPARLAKRLLILATLHGRSSEPGRMELRVSQSELANFAGISRQHVNQHLKQWQKKSWVDLGRERITICNADALRAFVSHGGLHH